MGPFKFVEPVTWHHQQSSVTNEYGDEESGGFVDIEMVGAFAPVTTRETETDRVISDAKLYLREPIKYRSRDQFTIRGQRFMVEGDSRGGWWSPYSGRVVGQEILLKRVTG